MFKSNLKSCALDFLFLSIEIQFTEIEKAFKH